VRWQFLRREVEKEFRNREEEEEMRRS